MEASVTGMTAEPKRPGGDTRESGRQVKALVIDPGNYAATSSSGIAVTT